MHEVHFVFNVSFLQNNWSIAYLLNTMRLNTFIK